MTNNKVVEKWSKLTEMWRALERLTDAPPLTFASVVEDYREMRVSAEPRYKLLSEQYENARSAQAFLDGGLTEQNAELFVTAAGIADRWNHLADKLLDGAFGTAMRMAMAGQYATDLANKATGQLQNAIWASMMGLLKSPVFWLVVVAGAGLVLIPRGIRR